MSSKKPPIRIKAEATVKHPDKFPTSLSITDPLKANLRPFATSKLQDEHKRILIKLIAEFHTPYEINEYFKEHYGFEMSQFSVYQYKKRAKWKGEIERIRKEYLERIDSVGGSHKRVRLERVERAYERALKTGDIKDVLATVEAQRKEMNEKEGTSTLSLIYNQYNLMTDEQIEAQRQSIIRRISDLKQGEKKTIDVTPTENSQP